MLLPLVLATTSSETSINGKLLRCFYKENIHRMLDTSHIFFTQRLVLPSFLKLSLALEWLLNYERSYD